jgi:hypothetical protein
MDEGQIELESGTWRWSVTDLPGDTNPHAEGFRPVADADPDEAPAPSAEDGQTMLMLQDPEDPEHWMVRDLPDTAAGDGLSEDDVAAMARDPDKRQLTDPSGGIWRIERIEKPEAVREDVDFERADIKVRISSEGGPPRLVPLPNGRTLGTMRREELLTLIEEG